jgi:hypothetical protein
MAHIHGDRKEGVGMFVKDHEWYFRHLTEHVHMKPSDLIIVEDVAQWCGENGLTEKDPHRMLRLVPGNGSVPRMLITSMIPDEIVDERIRALRIRSQLKNVGYDRADRLNSDMRTIWRRTNGFSSRWSSSACLNRSTLSLKAGSFGVPAVMEGAGTEG